MPAGPGSGCTGWGAGLGTSGCGFGDGVSDISCILFLLGTGGRFHGIVHGILIA